MVATITRQQLQEEMAAGSVVVLDALGGSYYEQQHLPGALPLVEDEVEAEAPRLVPDRSTPIVTYCSNPACANSTRVAQRLEQLGYTDVRKYAEGIADWVEAGLPVETGRAVHA
ncbi:rhodanese-like domain-containing protein [Geodermatophilus sp. DSM 44513]|uniref:rhodanese-like domain-containing protein n=1 Tax=Geodermatophilus sp. DSM 44513 TaxID=1528104 RepID=UPI001286540E|nr:rhodanese-like domain-containing protein [Geodermatophilus sp. DSM 44513]WNV75640.1 rhodanese-like domain-containing protein [Geodermatophilus sp. DSM 44513]